MVLVFFFNDTATTEIYTLSLHDALPISEVAAEIREHGGRALAVPTDVTQDAAVEAAVEQTIAEFGRSEEHTSELQSQSNLVCRLLLEKKNVRAFTHVQTHAARHTTLPGT